MRTDAALGDPVATSSGPIGRTGRRLTVFDSVDDLSARLAATGYFLDPVMIQVVFLAARLKKPLLLEGPAGSGKTQLALSVAARGRHPCGAAAVLSRR